VVRRRTVGRVVATVGLTSVELSVWLLEQSAVVVGVVEIVDSCRTRDRTTGYNSQPLSARKGPSIGRRRCGVVATVARTVVATVVYTTILLTGVVGNVSTCVVIATNRAMHSPTRTMRRSFTTQTYLAWSVHSPTNFYLLSLAVSDVLTLCLGK